MAVLDGSFQLSQSVVGISDERVELSLLICQKMGLLFDQLEDT